VSRKRQRRSRARRDGPPEHDPSSEKKAAAVARVVAARAVRRLNVVEYLLIAAAGGLSLGAGAVAGFALEAVAGLPFRAMWAASSLLFFVIPGVVVFGRERRARRTDQTTMAGSLQKENDGG